MRSDRDGVPSPVESTAGQDEDSSHLAHLAQLQREIADLAQFREAMDCCDDAIFILDADTGRIVDVSGSACRWLGLDRDALAGTSIGDFLGEGSKFVQGSPQDRHAAHLDCVTVMRGKDGTMIPVEIVISPARIDGKDIAIAIARDTSGRKSEEEKLRAALREKEVMLKEIHHRVKNNLQVISSLLSIQSTILADPRDARHFQESRDRIRTMALVHEKLYQSNDLARIDFGPYVERLAANLFRSYTGNAGRVSLRIDVKDVYLIPDQATPCGLIINELVTNALKYAFSDGRDGTITVAMRQEGEQYELVVSDNGVGMPAGFNLAETESLGLQLVNLLANQLGGTATMDTTQGTRFTIRFRRPNDQS